MTRTIKWSIAIGMALALCLAFAGAIGWSVYLYQKNARHQQLLVEAYQAVRNRECDAAIAKFDEALQQPLKKFAAAEAYANRAYCYSTRSQEEEALRDYTESIRLYPHFVWVFGARGVLHEQKGDSEKAVQDYSEAIRLDPNAADAFQRRGRIFLARQEFAKAIEDLKEAIRVWPKSAELYATLGEAQLRHDDRERALASFDTAIQLDPNLSRAYAKRAEVHRLQERWEKAFSDEARARAVEGGRSSLWSGLNAGTANSGAGLELIEQGNSALLTGQYDLAIEYYDKALASTLAGPNAAIAYMNRGNAFLRKRDLDRARADYDRAIEADPRNAGAHVNRASVHLGRDADVAIAECTTAIEIAPEFGEAYINRALAFGEKKEWLKAIADFKQAIALNSPRMEVALNSLAWVRATSEESSLRNADEAVEAATKACELTKWQNPAYLDTLAAAYAERGVFEKAVESQAKAIAFISESRVRGEMEERLQLYQMGKPYREK